MSVLELQLTLLSISLNLHFFIRAGYGSTVSLHPSLCLGLVYNLTFEGCSAGGDHVITSSPYPLVGPSSHPLTVKRVHSSVVNGEI